MKCPNCTETNLKRGENGALINLGTEQGHICSQADKYIRLGKWRGYSSREMASLISSQNMKDEKRLNEIREKSKSPYSS
jgi:hypothetical protein